jgi:hypothetical protein
MGDFTNAENIEEIYFPQDSYYTKIKDYSMNNAKSIQNSVKIILSNENMKLSSIYLPSSLTRIGDQAFTGLENLSKISYGDTNTLSDKESLGYIGNYAFAKAQKGGTSLIIKQLPDSLQTIR